MLGQGENLKKYLLALIYHILDQFSLDIHVTNGLNIKSTKQVMLFRLEVSYMGA